MSESNIFQTPPNPSNLLPKVIYFPEQWSDALELEQMPQDPISAEVVEPLELTFSSASSTVSNVSLEATSYNPQQEQLTQNREWFTLAAKLRQQNQELIKTLVQLEQALAESQHQLQHQKLRSRNVETLLTQQTQQLTKAQGQVTQLTRELEKTEQITQNQQLSLENLTQHLESTQQQAAQLERECAFLKQDNNEKTQKLISLEQQNQELRSRLHRQQRYTLQYKAALDQCLELSQAQFDHASTAASMNSPVRAIQPWSSNWQQISPNSLPESKLETNFDEMEIEKIFSPAITVNLNEFQEPILEQKSISFTTDISLSTLTDNTEEEEVDAFLDEFFASFEPDEPVMPEQIKTKKRNPSNWPSPLISPISSFQKPASKNLELPNFSRKSSH